MNLEMQAMELVESSRRRYGAYRSTHEAYGVLSEEVAELLEAIRGTSMRKIRREAMDVAAVALKLVADIDGDDGSLACRSGCIEHTVDAHCNVVDGECVQCGVAHGDPCAICGGRGFHGMTCAQWEAR